jgi:hypothetical protein
MALSRLNIRDRARARANQNGTDFPTDAQYNVFIDDAARDVYGDLVSGGWTPDFTTTTITATGADSYAIGSGVDLFGVIGVFADYAGGERVELHRLNEGDRAALRSMSAGGGPSEYYEVRTGTSGPVVYLYPKPTSGTYYVDHIPDFVNFAADGTIWRGPPRSGDLIVLRAARYGMLKEGGARLQEVAALDDEYGKQLAAVLRWAANFDMRNAPSIRDVTGRRTRQHAFDYPVFGPGDLDL